MWYTNALQLAEVGQMLNNFLFAIHQALNVSVVAIIMDEYNMQEIFISNVMINTAL